MMDYKSLFIEALAVKPPKVAVKRDKDDQQSGVLDSADDNEEVNGFVLDSAEFDGRSMALDAAAAIQQWAEDDDYEDGETSGDRLFGLMMGMVNEDKDGEVSTEEQAMFDDICDYSSQYLARMGVDSSDVNVLLDDFDDDVADRVRDAVLSGMPDGDGASDINGFVFGGNALDDATEDDEDDGEVLDKAFQAPKGQNQVTRGKNKAGYKTVVVVRKGERKVARKRIAGKVRLSPKQKAALKKARIKSKTAQAIRNWRKSNRLRGKLGLKNLKRSA